MCAMATQLVNYNMLKKDRNKLDRLWSEQVKEDAGNVCEICGNSADNCRLNSHHYTGRRVDSLRWVLQNGWCLCVKHHTMGKQSAHEDPVWFIEMARGIRGEKWYDQIKQLSTKINKFDFETNKLMMSESLEQILKRYEDS